MYDNDDNEPTLEDWAFIEGYIAYLTGENNPNKEYPHLWKAWENGLAQAAIDRADWVDSDPGF
jgi:hypothetical protein